MPRPPGRRVKCRAHSKRTGEPCRNWAVNGWRVCRMHGARGGAPPESMRGNTNALTTGERASVAFAGFMRPYLREMEPPDTPAAMLRNQARRAYARNKFMLWLLLDVEEAMEHFQVAGEWKGSSAIPALTPESVVHGPLALRRAIRRHGRTASGRDYDQTKLIYQSLFRRWLSLEDALNRTGALICRVTEQLRALEVSPAGTSASPGTVWVTFGEQAAPKQGGST